VTIPTDISYTWVNNDRGVDALVQRAQKSDFYFLDTEFHREKTYFPQLALVQICVDDEIYLVDPFEVSLGLLSDLFRLDRTCVLHAAQQDLDVLAQTVGEIPARIFDTQLSAGFLGYSQPALSSLVNSFLRISLPKGDRLSDWLRRPLTRDQLTYAASDVAYLPELFRLISHQLNERGRMQWATEACEELRTRPTGPAASEDAWLKVKDVRTLKGRSRWIARHVAMWREERAMQLNIPPRHVLSDIAILGIAQKAPRSLEELSKCRGVDQRHLGGIHGEALLSAVTSGIHSSQGSDLSFPTNDNDDVDKSMRSAVTLVSAWIAELARQSSLDVGLLATRRDIVELLSGAPTARLSQGWRAEIVGRDITDLVSGKKALTFLGPDGGGGLQLVEVAIEPK
jgi:ribonuclease D